MKHLAQKLPAWALIRLPVPLARQWARVSAPAAAVHADSALQLLIDVSVIHQSDARTGIQRVVRALLLQLLQSPPAGFHVCPIFATRRRGYCYAGSDFLEQPRQATGKIDRPVLVQKGDIFLGLDLAAHLLPRHQAQVLQWKRAGVRLHVVVYDLLPLLHPEWFTPATTRNFQRWLRWLAVFADSAICISEAVKMELHNWLDVKWSLTTTALPASTIVLGADIGASAPSLGLPDDAPALLAHLRNTSSTLLVGTLEPRKGHDQALAAFEHLWKQPGPGPSLILVGRPGWKTDILQEKFRNHPEVGHRLLWLKNVSDEYLTQLYAACSGVLVASRAEGFGLPLIEAALHGKPVLARDLPIFREIKVPDVTYFDSDTPEGLATALSHWMRATHTPPTMPSSNLPSWHLSASQLMRALGLQRQCQASPEAAALLDGNVSTSASASSPLGSVV